MSRDRDPPFFAGSVLGIRSWTVEEVPPSALPGGLALGAIAADARWETGGGWTSAYCRVRGAVGGHRAPEPGCSCGLYAWHPRPAAAAELRAETWGLDWDREDLPVWREHCQVAGVVEACGRIEVHEQGFRAQRARVRALVIGRGWPRSAAATVRRLARLYGAETLELGDPRELLAYCERLGGALTPERVDEILHPEHSRLRRRARRARARRAERRSELQRRRFERWSVRQRRWSERRRRVAEPLAAAGRRLRGTAAARGAVRACRLLVAGLGWALLFALGLLWYGGIAAICVMFAGGILFGWFDEEARPPPAKLRSVEVDRDRCLATAVIVARRPVRRAAVRVSGRDERGVGLGHLQRQLGPIPRGRSRIVVAGLDPKLCRSPLGFRVRARLVWQGRLGRPVEAGSPPRGPAPLRSPERHEVSSSPRDPRVRQEARPPSRGSPERQEARPPPTQYM